tara:strand:- start:76 stop:1320 length:1245 start_codon:yes stop_codon:yes gene_type:complete
MNKYVFSFLILFFCLSALSESELVFESCSFEEENFDIRINEKQETIVFTKIYGSGTDEDSQWLSLFNPFIIKKVVGNKIFASSSFKTVLESADIKENLYFNAAERLIFNMIIDVDMSNILLQFKISDSPLEMMDIVDLTILLREFGFEDIELQSGALIESALYSGCKIKYFEQQSENTPPSKEPSQSKTQDNEISLMGSGTGFFVNDSGYIVTNFHVIKACEYLIYNEESLKLIDSDPLNDISILKSNQNNDYYIDISRDSVVKGQDIYVIGYPFGTQLSGGLMPQSKLTKGVISSPQGMNNNYSQFQMDAAIQRGNSGGPVVDINGDLKGIAVSKAPWKAIMEELGDIPESINFAIKVDSLLTMLDANDIKYNISIKDRNNMFFGLNDFEESISNADKSTIYLECWGKNIQEN